jgi:lysozyme
MGKSADMSSKTYIVKKGDSLSEIAKAHDTTVKKLMALNPAIKSADKIEIGQKIKLP